MINYNHSSIDFVGTGTCYYTYLLPLQYSIMSFWPEFTPQGQRTPTQYSTRLWHYAGWLLRVYLDFEACSWFGTIIVTLLFGLHLLVYMHGCIIEVCVGERCNVFIGRRRRGFMCWCVWIEKGARRKPIQSATTSTTTTTALQEEQPL